MAFGVNVKNNHGLFWCASNVKETIGVYQIKNGHKNKLDEIIGGFNLCTPFIEKNMV